MLPSLREKKRYIVFKVESENELSKKDYFDLIKSSFKSFLGELGLAKAGILFLPDWKDGKGIIRVSHKEVDNIKAALSLVKGTNSGVKIKTLYVSGILDKARKIMEQKED